MRIQTIYPAFMGEVNKFGIGAPCVFVRTAGCNLRCYWKTLGVLCDTPEALKTTSGVEYTVGEIVRKVIAFGIPLVCLTGGEPLLQKEGELRELFRSLGSYGVSVVVETNGSCSIHKYLDFDNVSFVVDYKGSSSGEEQMMSLGNWMEMREDDWLKFVIYNKAEVEEMLHWCKTHRDFKGKVAAGLFWGTPNVFYGVNTEGIDKEARCRFNLLQRIIYENPQYNIHLNMQTHKLVCLYDKNLGAVQKIVAPKDL